MDNKKDEPEVSKRIEKMENRMMSIESLIKKLTDQLQSNSVLNNTHFVNDLDTDTTRKTFVAKMGTNGGLLDSGAPKAIVGKNWFKEYLNEHNLKEEDIKKAESFEVSKFGSGKTFESEGKVEFPVTLKKLTGENVNKTMRAHIIDAKIPFLIGLDILEEIYGIIDFALRN